MSGDEAMGEGFVLRCELPGHEADVRGVCGNHNGGAVSCSRDKTVRTWTPLPDNTFDSTVLLGHEHFVSCVLCIPPSENLPTGLILSGGYDRTMQGQTIVAPVVNVWIDGELGASLKGHSLTICCLAVDKDGLIYSASWDKSVMIWDLKTMSSVGKLEGHEQAVWSVLCLDDGGILSASADKTIKLWRGKQCVQTYRGHTDCVRSLALFPGVGFVSCGNDGSVRLWAVSGECLMVKQVSTSFLYGVAVLPTLEVAVVGEDKTCKVIRDSEVVCTLHHPGSVWSIGLTSEGDIITGCSDAVARVFTRAPERAASADAVAAYEARIGATAAGGGVKLDELPGEEALLEAGAHDGATKIVRKGKSAMVYSWNQGEGKWDLLGEQVDGPGDGPSDGKTMFNGKMYDRVIDVVLDDAGTDVRKIGYNYGENPYAVAQDFISDNDLSQENLTQIAEFIDKNVNQHVTLGEAAPPMRGADPLTGSHNVMNEASYSAPAAAPKDTVSFESDVHIPKKVMVFFEQGGKVDAVEKKLAEFNGSLAGSEHSMDDGDVTAFSEAAKIVMSGGKDSVSKPPLAVYPLITGKLLKWPADKLLPVLDLLRLLVLNPFAAKHYSSGSTQDPVLAVAGILSGKGPDDVPMPTWLMSMRFFVNCFRLAEMRAKVTEHCALVVEACSGASRVANANVQVAYATLLLDFAVLTRDVGHEKVAGGYAALINACKEPMASATDATAAYRVICAAGTLIADKPEGIKAANEAGLGQAAQGLAARVKDDKVAGSARQLCALL